MALPKAVLFFSPSIFPHHPRFLSWGYDLVAGSAEGEWFPAWVRQSGCKLHILSSLTKWCSSCQGVCSILEAIIQEGVPGELHCQLHWPVLNGWGWSTSPSPSVFFFFLQSESLYWQALNWGFANRITVLSWKGSFEPPLLFRDEGIVGFSLVEGGHEEDINLASKLVLTFSEKNG